VVPLADGTTGTGRKGGSADRGGRPPTVYVRGRGQYRRALAILRDEKKD